MNSLLSSQQTRPVVMMTVTVCISGPSNLNFDLYVNCSVGFYYLHTFCSHWQVATLQVLDQLSKLSRVFHSSYFLLSEDGIM